MKITIKKTVQIPEIPSEVETDSGSTLQNLLDRLLRETYFAREVTDQRTGELTLDGIFKVELNGVSYYSLPQGLATELTDGDTLTLTLILIGGG
ncbi:MAG TPA: hypothetical protein VMT62_12370 [Syntrophorhabdaceae bacterium]|nr:hypothetical protein [Syntrophorhabdaceae bacterium]